jgi:N-acetylglutamate synthase-like GNAT family acetyltransferase
MDIFPHVVSSDAHKTILIHCIYVPDEKHKGKGIATSLMSQLIKDLRKPHQYLNGDRFEKIMVLAGKNRPGPAGPEEFFRKIGFVDVKQVTEEDVLMQMQLNL